MVMIENKGRTRANERDIVSASHIGQHLHLTAALHIKHRVHMEAATRMKGNPESSSSQPISITNKGLMQELSTLQMSPVFMDPPMGPSCENIHNEMVLRRCDSLAVLSKEACAQLGSSDRIESVPYQNKNCAKQERKRASLERKIRRKRVKVFAIKSNKSVVSTGLSTRSSCSLQSSKVFSFSTPGASLPLAKRTHLPDMDGLLENECTASWSSSRVYSKAQQISSFLGSKCIALGLVDTSPPHANSDVKLSVTADMLYNSCQKEDSGAPTSLSIKYAPKSLRDIIGQHLVTQALSNALSKGRVAPMYIFYGPQGTGKTSCSRLFALALNCLSTGDRPCGTCRLCSAQISGKISPIKEVRAGQAYQVKEVTSLVNEISWSSSFLYKICIVDECQALSVKVWNSLLKGTKAASKKTIFIFNTLSIEHIPHAVVSRCQKFHFSKIKERDIINKLQMIALQESLNADIDAIRLIASVSNGSLYDAELMLDHISLIGKRVKVPVVRDLVGLIPDSALMELLDSALSANMVNTIQSLKEFHELGVEPLNLISQLASLITRILAGGYHVSKGKLKSRFFQSKELTKDGTQRLRQALKVLSEAEKQLQNSPHGVTWLLAALLQFAPDQSYIASSCPATTPTCSPLERTNIASGVPEGLENAVETDKQTVEHCQSGPIALMSNAPTNSLKTSTLNSTFQQSGAPSSPKLSQCLTRSKIIPHLEAENVRTHDNLEMRSNERDDLEQLWQRVLDAINSNNLKCFLRTQGKLVSISLHKEFKEALLEFHHLEHLSRVQRSKASILHAFQATLGHHVKVKVHLVSRASAHQTKQNRLQHKAADLDVAQLATIIYGSGRSESKLKISEGYSGRIHKETELKDSHKPHMVYGTLPKLVNSYQKIIHDEKAQVVPADNTELGRLTNSMKCTPQNAQHMHAWLQGNCSSLDNGVSIGYVLEKKEEDGIERNSVDFEFNHMNMTSKQDSTGYYMCSNASPNRNSGQLAAELQEENLKNELAPKEMVCWEATNNVCGSVECFQQPCSKHSKFLLGLFPCANVKRSHGTSGQNSL